MLAALGGEFFLERPEHLRRDPLQLEAHLIGGTAAALHAVAAFSAEPVGEQPPLLGQGLAAVGCDFGQRQAVLAPGHEVAGIRDRNHRRIPAAVDRARAMDLEEFGMQRPPVELEDQFSDFGTSRQHEMPLHRKTRDARWQPASLGRLPRSDSYHRWIIDRRRRRHQAGRKVPCLRGVPAETTPARPRGRRKNECRRRCRSRGAGTGARKTGPPRCGT